MSWIRRVKRGNQIYLYEMTSVWEDGRPKQKLIQYLGVESDVEKVPKPKTKRYRPDQIFPSESLVAGNVMLLWKVAESLNFVNTIDFFAMGAENIEGPSPGKYLLTWAINRLIDPESATQLNTWVRSTTLPDLVGMDPLDFTKDAYLRSLDTICSQSLKTGKVRSQIPTIEAELYQKWRMIYPLPAQNPETIAFDLSSIPTYGQECPLIEPGSKTHETHLNQLNLSVITSYFDSYPISHFVHPGSFHSITTIPDLMIRLKEMEVSPGTIVWDRGYTTKEQINRVEKEGWKLVCGVTKRTNEVKDILFQAEPPLDPDHLVPTQCMNIYAEKIDSTLFGNEGSVVVYLNVERQWKEMKSRNCTLLRIQSKLAELKKSCAGMDINAINESIAKVVPKPYEKFFKIEICEDENGIEIEWEADNEARIRAEKMDGKYLLYASDLSLSATDVVRMYFERDFVEKVFRDLKTFEEISPIRHRKESRVLGIMFVCTLALRLKIALRKMLENVEEKNVSAEMLLKQLGRVHRVTLQKDTEVDIWYTGLQEKQKKILNKMGMKDLFGDRVR